MCNKILNHGDSPSLMRFLILNRLCPNTMAYQYRIPKKTLIILADTNSYDSFLINQFN